MVLGAEIERPAVLRPQRPKITHEWRAGAVEARGQATRLAAPGGYDVDAAVAPHVERILVARIRDQPAVRRPCGVAAWPSARRHPPRLSAIGRHDPDVDNLVVVAVLVASGGEHQLFPVGRPVGGAVIPVAVGDLFRLGDAVRGQIYRDDEDVTALVVNEAFAVRLVAQRRDDPRGLRLLLLFLVRFIGHTTHCQRDAAAVGRPDRLTGRALEVREPLRLAAVYRHHVQLPLFVVALGNEGEQPSVGRPTWRVVALWAAGELHRLAACHRHDPDVGQVLILVLVHLGLHEGNARSVGRNPRVAGRGQAEKIGHGHRAALCVRHVLPPLNTTMSRPTRPRPPTATPPRSGRMGRPGCRREWFPLPASDS